MKNKLFIISFLALNFCTALAQKDSDSLTLSINLKWKNQPLEINTKYISKNNDTLLISQLKFYLSDIQILFEDEFLFKETKHHLINMEELHSINIPITKKHKKIKTISFSVGVDSLASVSGALSGDLDPSNGMYWAWQSGYINMKIEGSSSSCKTRKNAFHFHIGGYLEPNYALRKVTLYPKSENLELEMDLAKLFDNLLLSETNSIMIPGKEAMKIADLSAQIFSCK